MVRTLPSNDNPALLTDLNQTAINSDLPTIGTDEVEGGNSETILPQNPATITLPPVGPTDPLPGDDAVETMTP
jgi:hypothetical protein